MLENNFNTQQKMKQRELRCFLLYDNHWNLRAIRRLEK